ncbi:7014_t:CDS:2 [Diversispora eburnea]|uniref:Chitin synthase n=2 Tax=Diversisporales TaxID=214509 RepID=A0A9N8YML3_9GLOM|nr:7014_t:CDS:2 [Diversispora eburnea]
MDYKNDYYPPRSPAYPRQPSPGFQQQRGYQQSSPTYPQQQANYSGYDYEEYPTHSPHTPKPPTIHNNLQRQQIIYPEHNAVNFDYDEQIYNEKINKRKSTRHVELTQGNLILDCPVPDKILRNVKYTTDEEFTTMRYTAVTCDPDDFVKSKYLLRPHIYGRDTELMIVMTMYNEDDQLFIKTMSSAIKNVAFLRTRGKSKTWGPDGWKKVVVVVVSDGRNKVNKRTLKVLGAMGVYQDGIMQDNVDGKAVTGHLFEFTSQLMVDSDFNIRGQDKGIPPVQILFCLKEKNAKKLNSHRWFFNAFAAQLNPNVCILLDVGTKPSHTSIYHLWKGCMNLINPLVASQNFEYKMSNILDKPLESVFGYISVLPGAFSAYRFRALQNTSPGKGPLASYFKGEAMHGSGAANAGIFEANMYLAEDRILCFELVAKKKQAWKLKYVKDAKAETDVPDNVPEFISQRRRWLNGSFFAAFYSGNFFLAFFFLTQSTTSNPATDPFRGYGDELFDLARSLYLMVIITIFISSMGNRPQGSKTTYTLCIILFATIMATMLYCAGYTVYLALSSGPDPVNFTSFKSIKEAIKTAAFRDIVISLASTYGLFLFSSLIHGEPWHMITCLVQYILLVPFYVNILMVYAFCNTHDVSWGTKGDNGGGGDLGGAKPVTKDGKQVMKVEVPTEREDINAMYDNLLRDLKTKIKKETQHRDAATKKEDYYKNFRTNLVLAWMFSNAFLIVFFTSNTWKKYVAAHSNGNAAFNPYLTFVFWSVTALSAFRAFGCVWYLILRLIFG